MEHKVTEREREILEQISYGHQTKEIAVLLHISPHTVTTHKNNLYIKLRAKNTAHLVRIAFTRGILTLESAVSETKF